MPSSPGGSTGERAGAETSEIAKYDLFNSDSAAFVRTWTSSTTASSATADQYVNRCARSSSSRSWPQSTSRRFLQTLPSPSAGHQNWNPSRGGHHRLDSSCLHRGRQRLWRQRQATIPGGSRMFTSIELRLIERWSRTCWSTWRRPGTGAGVKLNSSNWREPRL